MITLLFRAQMLQPVQLFVLLLVLPLNVGNVQPDILLPGTHLPGRGAGGAVILNLHGDNIGHSDGFASNESLCVLLSLWTAIISRQHFTFASTIL